MRLVVQPEVENDILEAALWYDRRAKVFRQNFLDAVDAAFAAIGEHPYRYQTIFREVRRVMVGGFPYALFYVASEQEVNVIACFHCSRDPKRWQHRTR